MSIKKLKTKRREKHLNYRILFLVSAFFLTTQSHAGQIVYPWRATRSIVENKNTFEILFNNIDDRAVQSVALESKYHKTILKIKSIKKGKFEYDNFTKAYVNSKILVEVPPDTPEDLYNLIIKCGGTIHISTKAVKVIKEFKKSHLFIHISDTHVTRQWIGTPEDGYGKELELLDKFIDVANIINPDFIITTGDNIMDYTRINANAAGWGGKKIKGALKAPSLVEKWVNYYDGSHGLRGIHGLNSPVFSLPGNHDFYGLAKDDFTSKAAQWNKMCGLREYGFRYGNTTVATVDDFLTGVEGLPMLKMPQHIFKNYIERKGEYSGVKILAKHSNSKLDIEFLNKYKINALLHGHDHIPYQEEIGTTPTLFSRPGVVCRSGVRKIVESLGFFRIFTIENGRLSASEPIRFTSDPQKNHKEIPLNLLLNYDKPNDGTALKNRAVITNKLGINLPECKIRFVMKKGTYKVSNGSIYQTFDSNEFTIVDIKVDSLSETAEITETTEVTIY